VFGTVKGRLDVRYGSRDGSACAEFSWEGFSDADPACGRGWAALGTAGRLVGHIFIHNPRDFFNSLLDAGCDPQLRRAYLRHDHLPPCVVSRPLDYPLDALEAVLASSPWSS
jgi:hypothetical protein